MSTEEQDYATEMLGAIRQGFAAGQQARAETPQAHAEHRCVSPPLGCGRGLGKPLNEAFRDRQSLAEYNMLGTCQACQDVMFSACLPDVEEMAADPDNFGRCRCGKYCPYQHVDVGVGVIKGFDCCPPVSVAEQLVQRCTRSADCQLDDGHVHGCDV